MLELHVWGPAFGLPSIDPECIASVAYLKLLAQSAGIEWTLIPDDEPLLSPNHDFPALRDDRNSKWIAGYQSIVRYLGRLTDGYNPLDARLTPQARADAIAFSAFLYSCAQPLLDLALYTTYENYCHGTRPAFTEILPWQANYTVPPARRVAAKARTEHLGFASLDVDTLNESPVAGSSISSQYEAAKRAVENKSIARNAGQRPSLLPLGRKRTMGGLLGQAEYTDRFRLDALANGLFGPMSELLGQKDFLLSDKMPSSLDCLALGYLSLTVYPTLPQAWLAETIRTRFSTLYRYVQRMREMTFGPKEIDGEDIMSLSKCENTEEVKRVLHEKGRVLPWSPLPKQGVGAVAERVGRDLLGLLPSPWSEPSIHAAASEADIPQRPDQFTTASKGAEITFATLVVAGLRAISVGIVGLSGSIVLFQYYRRKPEDDYVFEWSSRRHRPTTFADLGEAGAALAALSDQMQYEAAWQRELQRLGGSPVANMDVEIGEKLEVEL